MNSNYWQGKRSGALTLTLFAAVVAIAGMVVPAQAQTYPVAFPSPTTFTSSLATANSSVAVATGDFNGDGKLDVVTLDYTANLNVILGKGNGTFQSPITLNLGPPPISTGTEKWTCWSPRRPTAVSIMTAATPSLKDLATARLRPARSTACP